MATVATSQAKEAMMLGTPFRLSMKIRLNAVPQCTGEQFADKHGLPMQVFERSSESAVTLPRYFAYLYGVEICENGFLRSCAGNGNTPEEAIADYWPQISEKCVRIKGGSTVTVPRLIKQ